MKFEYYLLNNSEVEGVEIASNDKEEINNYLVDMFLGGVVVPKELEGYIDEEKIINDLLIGDYNLVERGDDIDDEDMERIRKHDEEVTNE